MIPIPNPRDSQCLSGKVGRRGVNVFVLDVDIVGAEDGVIGVSRVLCAGLFVIPCAPRASGVFGVVSGARRRSIVPWVC